MNAISATRCSSLRRSVADCAALAQAGSRVRLCKGAYDAPAGVAYTGDRGLARVEFSTDDGDTWQPAELVEPPVGRDAWVRWIGRFSLQPGAQLSLRSRVTDGTGMPQAKEFSLPQPDGSAGWPTVPVSAAS